MKYGIKLQIATLVMVFGLAIGLTPGFTPLYGEEAVETSEEAPVEQIEAEESAQDAPAQDAPAREEKKGEGVGEISVPQTQEGKYAVWATAAGTVLLFIVLILKSRKLDE